MKNRLASSIAAPPPRLIFSSNGIIRSRISVRRASRAESLDNSGALPRPPILLPITICPPAMPGESCADGDDRSGGKNAQADDHQQTSAGNSIPPPVISHDKAD